MRPSGGMLKTPLGMKQRLLINTFVGAHILGSHVTRFQTSGVRALTGLTWSRHSYLLPRSPGVPAQADAFSSSMSRVTGVSVSTSDHGPCWFGHRPVDPVAGLTLDQPGDPSLIRPACLILVTITKPDPDPDSCSWLHPGLPCHHRPEWWSGLLGDPSCHP